MVGDVVIKNDDSVTRKIEKTAKHLQKRYSRTKNKDLEKQVNLSLSRKIFNGFVDVFSFLMVVVCGLMCFSLVNSKLQRVAPTFMGYSVMKIASQSMVASGFNVGDNIAVRKVDAKTLKKGDKIAFYVYSDSYKSFNINTCTLVRTERIEDLKYDNNLKHYIGLHSKEIITAGRNGAMLVFHEVYKVFEDDNGERWFQTKGSSNDEVDFWFISEKMVMGIYQEGKTASTIANVVGKISSSLWLLLGLLFIPIMLMAYSIVREYLYNLKIAYIEDEIVKGKRKLNDPFCVKNGIGYGLSERDKIKVLVWANDDEKLEYINLLWKHKKPVNIQKHYLRKQLMLREYEDKLTLHNECEEMFANGDDIKEIAKYYLKQRKLIEKHQENINKRLKILKANEQAINLDHVEQQIEKDNNQKLIKPKKKLRKSW